MTGDHVLRIHDTGYSIASSCDRGSGRRRVKKVAVVTDSALGNVAERLASHFVEAETKQFPAGEAE